MKLLITGGAGFIGSAVIRYLLSNTNHEILNVDKLTYAANLESLSLAKGNPKYNFAKGDICDKKLITTLFESFKPNWVMHLAAETHVDRSIDNAKEFIQTNIVGTSVMLEATREYWKTLSTDMQKIFRFHNISTDEVFGSLPENGFFTEESSYKPNSPYSASKASSDHLVRAWHQTYGIPVLITNCSNNYGYFQFPEKLIPLMILNALEHKSLPIYGDGQQIRDWLYVDDHAEALYQVILKGKIGETYIIGGHNEKTNFEVVNEICDLLDVITPIKNKRLKSYRELIKFVRDRPGHDKRYAINTKKLFDETGWVPKETFKSGLKKTINWYIKNKVWCKKSKRERLGLI